MAWTTPKTNWATGELVTAEDMNAIAENLVALKHPPTVVGTTTQEKRSPVAFGDVDSDNLNLTITTAGGDVLVHFEGAVKSNHSTHSAGVHFDIEADGNRQGQADGLISVRPLSRLASVSITRLLRNLSAGVHTFKLQWKHDFYSNQSPSGVLDDGAQFWVREI